MHVAVFGAGALGSVYGVRLALRTRARVSFVVRPSRVTSGDPLVIERVKNVRDRREEIAAPVRTSDVPGDADVILLTVGTEDLEAIRPILDASSGPSPSRSARPPIIVLTPMMPADYARMRSAFGDRVLAALAGIVAYARKEDGVVRYWMPPVVTRIDEPRAGADGDVVRELATLLSDAGLNTHLELAVHETNPATTVCMIPIGMSVGLAGGMEELAKDDSLLALTSRACTEGLELARRIGRPEPGVMLAPLLARPLVMSTIVAALRRFNPEALFYIDEHFGRKLRAQNRVMAREIAELARTKQVAHKAIDELGLRLEEARLLEA